MFGGVRAGAEFCYFDVRIHAAGTGAENILQGQVKLGEVAARGRHNEIGRGKFRVTKPLP